jgi:hypothetical protein
MPATNCMLLFELHPDKISMDTRVTTGHMLDFVHWLEVAGLHMTTTKSYPSLQSMTAAWRLPLSTSHGSTMF